MKLFSIKFLRQIGCIVGASFMMMSCDMINEDMPECAKYPNTFTTIKFVYDFNMQNRDLFNEHVGTAHLYVFDKDGVFLFDSVASRVMMPGKTVDFTMTFDTTRIKTGHKYQFIAMAQGNHVGYEWSTVVTPGFQIPLEHEMIPGESTIDTYRIKLDRDGDKYADFGIVNYKDAYGNNKEMIDTLWSTKPGNIKSLTVPYIELKPQVEEFPVFHQEVEIPMMRITNAITVNLLHDSFQADQDPERFKFDIFFPKGNGTINMTGDTDFPENQPLYYRSIRKETVVYRNNNNNMPVNGDGTKGETIGTRADQYAIQATFGVSRLQITDCSCLEVRNPDGELLFTVPENPNEDDSFSSMLSDFFNRYDERQDFLDKEYKFDVDIHLDDKYMWSWAEVRVEALNWTVRKFNYIPK